MDNSVTDERGVREALVSLSHELGEPKQAMAILGEGNVSARLDGATFLVKASGSELRTLRAEQLTAVSFEKALAFLEASDQSDSQVAATLEASKVYKQERRPSVETFMHAVCLTTGKARYVGHTHPEAINSILCSQAGVEAVLGPIFPDQIVVCGLHWLVVPYVDPGIGLAVALKRGLEEFEAEHGTMPKLILLENHGAVALGATGKEVASILEMAHKWARIVLGSFAMGGPKFLPDALAQRIEGRDDELVRKKALGLA